MTRDQSPAPKRVPERTCIGCGAKKEQSSLVRLALGPGGQITIDRTGKAGGRGAWLCGAGCLKAALKRKAFARAFRGKAAPFEATALEAALRGPSLQREEIGLDAAARKGDAARKG
jgi:predicted RNA-binding protein YlxR (DUF448 family)